jgi:hypothetical protein
LGIPFHKRSINQMIFRVHLLMSRKRIPELLLALVSLLVSISVCELALRWLYPCPWYGYDYVSAQQFFFRFNSELGWSGRPNASGTFAAETFMVQVTHNANGHRASVPPEVEGKTNVIVLGDSFAWGWGVEEDERFSEQMMRLDAELNVYNLGAPGYGTDQEYLVLRNFLEQHPDLEPDMIVLQFFENDWFDNDDVWRYGYPKPRFELRGDALELVNVPVPNVREKALDGERTQSRPRGSLANRLHLYNLLAWRLGWLDLPSADDDAESERNTEASEEQGDLALRLMLSIARLARSRGAGFHVVLLYPKDTPAWRKLQDGLDQALIPFLTFRGRQSLGRTELWIDGHLNRTGHALLASQLLESIRDPRFSIDGREVLPLSAKD